MDDLEDEGVGPARTWEMLQLAARGKLAPHEAAELMLEWKRQARPGALRRADFTELNDWFIAGQCVPIQLATRTKLRGQGLAQRRRDKRELQREHREALGVVVSRGPPRARAVRGSTPDVPLDAEFRDTHIALIARRLQYGPLIATTQHPAGVPLDEKPIKVRAGVVAFEHPLLMRGEVLVRDGSVCEGTRMEPLADTGDGGAFEVLGEYFSLAADVVRNIYFRKYPRERPLRRRSRG